MQIILTLGIVVAQAINLGTQHIAGYGWRISLACAGIPAIVLTLGGLLLPDTPNSLIDRGREDEGKQVGFCFPRGVKLWGNALQGCTELACVSLAGRVLAL